MPNCIVETSGNYGKVLLLRLLLLLLSGLMKDSRLNGRPDGWQF